MDNKCFKGKIAKVPLRGNPSEMKNLKESLTKYIEDVENLNEQMNNLITDEESLVREITQGSE